jgi:hypothetical protein
MAASLQSSVCDLGEWVTFRTSGKLFTEQRLREGRDTSGCIIHAVAGQRINADGWRIASIIYSSEPPAQQ